MLYKNELRIDLIHDTHHLCTRLRIDGINDGDVTWFLRGQTSEKIANGRNRG